MCVNTLLSPPHGACYFVYYETIKRKLNRILIYECRCDERLKAKTEGSTRLAYTGLRGGLEHLKIKTRLIDERFASVMGEYVILTVPVVPTWLCGTHLREGILDGLVLRRLSFLLIIGCLLHVLHVLLDV
jgi:hypothetical protein